MQDISGEIVLKRGRMKKSPLDMTPAEREEWYMQIQENARAYIFSLGQPLVYRKNGVMIAEYADGSIEDLS